MKQALEGIRILDFSHVYQGPVGTQILADFGADVIKVELPGRGDWSRAWGPFVNGVSLPYANLNRNKRSIALNLKNPEGKAIIGKLVETADVLVHNFRGGVMEKLGFGYEEVSVINPGIVYAASSGWGDAGPYVERGRAGHDMMARAEGGWFIDPGAGKAPIPGGFSVDYPAGLMLMQGILIALLHRQRTGEGQKVSTDLISVAFHAHAWDAASQLNAERIDESARVGGTEAAINKAFLTSDGAIEISPVFSDNALRDISLALGLEDLSEKDLFCTEEKQIENSKVLNELLAGRFREKPTDVWMAELEAKGVLCAKVNTFADAAADPQIRANDMILDVTHPRAGSLRLLGTPVRLHGTPASHEGPPPDLGEHSTEVLADLGYPEETIREYTARGIIATPPQSQS